jgi:hypothetical protein
MSDYPLHECVATAAPLIRLGATIHQKFTCSHCNARQAIAEANQFFTQGKCEKCNQITDIAKRGCNYMVIWGAPRPIGGIQ